MEKDKMKIAVWHNLPSGGSSRALHEQLRGLHQRGHQIELWTNPMADLAYLNVKDFDVNLNFRQYDQLSSVSSAASQQALLDTRRELQLALSKRFFNNSLAKH